MDAVIITTSVTAAVATLFVLGASISPNASGNDQVDSKRDDSAKVEVVNARMYTTSKALPDVVFVAGGPQHFTRPISSKDDGGQAGATASNFNLSATKFDTQYVLYDKGYLKDDCGYCIHKFNGTYFVVVVSSASDTPDKWTNLSRDLGEAFDACKKLDTTCGKDPDNPVWVPLFGNGIFGRKADSSKSQSVVVEAARRSELYVIVYTG